MAAVVPHDEGLCFEGPVNEGDIEIITLEENEEEEEESIDIDTRENDETMGHEEWIPPPPPYPPPPMSPRTLSLRRAIRAARNIRQREIQRRDMQRRDTQRRDTQRRDSRIEIEEAVVQHRRIPRRLGPTTVYAWVPRPRLDLRRPPPSPSSEHGSSTHRMCRFCLGYSDEDSDDSDESLGELVAPCLCRGTVRWVHEACLNRWRGRFSPRGFGSTNCMQCRSSYILPRDEARIASFRRRPLLDYAAPRQPLRWCEIFEIICVIWLFCLNSGLLIWSSMRRWRLHDREVTFSLFDAVMNTNTINSVCGIMLSCKTALLYHRRRTRYRLPWRVPWVSALIFSSSCTLLVTGFITYFTMPPVPILPLVHMAVSFVTTSCAYVHKSIM